jgi:hypothetical protein
MADGLGEFEYELEFEGEGEFENEFEAEFEGEGFGWDDVKTFAGNEWKALSTPGSAERKAVLGAAKVALPLVGTGLGSLAGGRLGNAKVGGTIGGGIGTWAAGLMPDQEGEFEFENEFESEFEGEGEFELAYFANPVARAYPDALMEHMGLAALEAENEYEAAEHFAPLIPVVASKLLPAAARAMPRAAARTLPHVAKVITHATPHLTRSVTQLTRTLHRDPRTRPLVRVIPSVARRAVTTIARHAATGRPVSPQHAVRILAHTNHNVLRSPRTVRAVLHRAHGMDRHARQVTGLPIHAGHPHHHHHLHGGLPYHLRHLHPRHPQVLHWHARRRMLAPGVAAPGVAAPVVAGAAGVSVPPRFAGVAPRIIASRIANGGVAAGGVCPTCGRPAARACCCC